MSMNHITMRLCDMIMQTEDSRNQYWGWGRLLLRFKKKEKPYEMEDIQSPDPPSV